MPGYDDIFKDSDDEDDEDGEGDDDDDDENVDGLNKRRRFEEGTISRLYKLKLL